MNKEKVALLEYLERLPKEDEVTLCCGDGDYNMTVRAAIEGVEKNGIVGKVEVLYPAFCL